MRGEQADEQEPARLVVARIGERQGREEEPQLAGVAAAVARPGDGVEADPAAVDGSASARVTDAGTAPPASTRSPAIHVARFDWRARRGARPQVSEPPPDSESCSVMRRQKPVRGLSRAASLAPSVRATSAALAGAANTQATVRDRTNGERPSA